jgi:regulator of protease activity HflC (stomatin/prohibitin superfamily)
MSGTSGLTVRSSDNLNIQMDISVVYHLQPDKVADILIDYGDFHEILDRYIRNVPRNVASNFTGEYIGGIGRVVVEDEIRRSMTSELAVYSIVLEDVLLRSVDLPDTVDIAIEEKLAAQQKVVTAELVRQATVIQALANADVIRILAEGQRNATIIQANGTAESIRIVIDQLRISDPDLTNATWAYLTLLYIEALTDPDSNVSFVIIQGDGVPIIIQPRP